MDSVGRSSKGSGIADPVGMLRHAKTMLNDKAMVGLETFLKGSPKLTTLYMNRNQFSKGMCNKIRAILKRRGMTGHLQSSGGHYTRHKTVAGLYEKSVVKVSFNC